MAVSRPLTSNATPPDKVPLAHSEHGKTTFGFDGAQILFGLDLERAAGQAQVKRSHFMYRDASKRKKTNTNPSCFKQNAILWLLGARSANPRPPLA